jgi:hypothetical protein
VVVENQLPQKHKSIGRTPRTLRGIHNFIDEHLTTKAVVVVTVLLLLASWIYPPWIIGSGRYVSHGWFFVFDTTGETAMRVDFGRLFLIDAIIAAAGGLLAWAVFGNSTARRVTVRLFFYGLIVLWLIAIAWIGAVAIGNVQSEVAKRARQPKRFDWSTGTLVEKPKTSSLYDAIVAYLARQRPVTVEIPGHGLAEFPAGMSSKEIVAVIKKKFEKPKFDPDKYLAQIRAQREVVAPVDLKKITLFDVVANVTAGNREYRFHGKVRNDLPRTVQQLGARASFYNANGDLIEGRTFWIRGISTDRNDPNFGLETDTLSAGSAVSFDESIQVSFLPESSLYHIELIEAHYVPEQKSEYDVLLEPTPAVSETKPSDPDAYLREKAREKPIVEPTATPIH